MCWMRQRAAARTRDEQSWFVKSVTLAERCGERATEGQLETSSSSEIRLAFLAEQSCVCDQRSETKTTESLSNREGIPSCG